MAFVFDGLLFSQQNVSVDQYLFFPFLHAHLQLVLLVFKPVDVVGGLVEVFLDLFDFELHDVVLHQHLLLLLSHLAQVLDSHVVLQRQFLDLGVQLLLGRPHVVQLVLNCSQVIVQLFHALIEDFELTLDLGVFLASFLNILLQVLLFFKSPLSSGPGYFPLHQLDLILSVVEQFLLFLELLVKFVDMTLQIAAGRHDALYFPVKRSFFFSELEQLLSIPD